jgi:hypothetical protein
MFELKPYVLQVFQYFTRYKEYGLVDFLFEHTISKWAIPVHIQSYAEAGGLMSYTTDDADPFNGLLRSSVVEPECLGPFKVKKSAMRRPTATHIVLRIFSSDQLLSILS